MLTYSGASVEGVQILVSAPNLSSDYTHSAALSLAAMLSFQQSYWMT